MRTKCVLTNAALVSLLAVTALASSSCGNAPVRSAERFCGELTVHKNDIRTAPTSDETITKLITLYSTMGEVAPLDIQNDWDQLSTNLKTANTVNVKDPASVQKVADSAYAAQQAAERVAAWARTTCGLDIGPVGTA
jgi:hypothetical protein